MMALESVDQELSAATAADMSVEYTIDGKGEDTD